MNPSRRKALALIRRLGVWALVVIGILFVFGFFLSSGNYDSNRSRVSEGLQLAAGAKTSVTEYYNAKGAFPTNNLSAGLAMPASIRGENVSSVAVRSSPAGSVLVTYSGNPDTLQGRTMLLIPTTRGGRVVWSCSNATTATLLPKYRPASCRP